MAKADTPRLTPTTSYFDVTDRPSMGDPEYVEGQVRLMLDEARDVLFEGKEPQAEIVALANKWAKRFRADNDDLVQTLSLASQDVWLKSRGLGTDDSEPGAPVLALVAHTLGRFVDAATAYHDEKIGTDQLQFAIDTAVEDCTMLLLGLDNAADEGED